MNRKRNIWLLPSVAAVMCLIVLLGLGGGSGGILWAYEWTTWSPAQKIIFSYRAMRVLTAFIVGGALATAGLAYQAVLRNPLAEPYILGVSGGASLGAALAIGAGVAGVWIFGLPLAAFAGALLALGLVWLVAGGRRLEYSHNLLLAGVIVSTLTGSILMFIISTLVNYKLNSITWWMLGNLQGQNSLLVYFAGSVTLVGTGVMWLLGREANVLALGEEMAHSFGVHPERTAKWLLVLASLLAASAVATAGIIGFVGLVVPHILRRLLGADHRKLFPFALLGGGAFLVLCDLIARSASAAQEIPVGVVTALIGGPFFLYLLRRKRGKSPR